MKRNDDLIRQLLFEAEASPREAILFPGMILLSPSEEEETRAHHAKLLADAGLFAKIGDAAFRLTNAGHDWLASVRDDTVWNRTKDAASKAGGVGLHMMGSIAMGFVKAKLIENGVPLA